MVDEEEKEEDDETSVVGVRRAMTEGEGLKQI